MTADCLHCGCTVNGLEQPRPRKPRNADAGTLVGCNLQVMTIVPVTLGSGASIYCQFSCLSLQHCTAIVREAATELYVAQSTG